MDTEKVAIIKKLNELQDEILHIGWDGILAKYHPEVNIDHPNPADLFKLYSHVYKNMKSRISFLNSAVSQAGKE